MPADRSAARLCDVDVVVVDAVVVFAGDDE